MNSDQMGVYQTLVWNLQNHWTQYHHCLGDCCRKSKTGAVHDFRIALRRLLSLLDLIMAVRPHHQTQKLRKELKSELKLMRDLRDYQNQKKSLDSELKPKQLQKFRASLNQNRKKEQKRVRTELKKIPLKKQSWKIQCLCEDLLTQSALPLSERRASKILNQQWIHFFKTFESAVQNAQENSPSSVHQARIQFKKFRYTWEALGHLFPVPAESATQMKNIQKLLGKIQDSNVLIQMLFEFLVKNQIGDVNSEVYLYFESVGKRRFDSIAKFFAIRNEIPKSLRPRPLPADERINHGLRRSHSL